MMLLKGREWKLFSRVVDFEVRGSTRTSEEGAVREPWLQ